MTLISSKPSNTIKKQKKPWTKLKILKTQKKPWTKLKIFIIGGCVVVPIGIGGYWAVVKYKKNKLTATNPLTTTITSTPTKANTSIDEQIKKFIIDQRNNKSSTESVNDFLIRLKNDILHKFIQGNLKNLGEYLYQSLDSKHILFSSKALNLIFEKILNLPIPSDTIKQAQDFKFKQSNILNPQNDTYNTLLTQYNPKTNENKIFKLTYQKIKAAGDGHCMYNSMDLSTQEIINASNGKTDLSLVALGHFFMQQDLLIQDKPTGIEKNLIQQNFAKLIATSKKFYYPKKTQKIKDLNDLYNIFHESISSPKNFIDRLVNINASDNLYEIKTSLEGKNKKTMDKLYKISQQWQKNPLQWDPLEKEFNDEYENLNCDDLLPTINQLIEECLKKNTSNRDPMAQEFSNNLKEIQTITKNKTYLIDFKNFIQLQLEPSHKIFGDTNLFITIVRDIFHQKFSRNLLNHEFIDEKLIHYIMFNDQPSSMAWNGDQSNFLKITDDFNGFSWKDFEKFNCILFNGNNHFDRIQLIHHEEIKDL
jgi:hypothetical protein